MRPLVVAFTSSLTLAIVASLGPSSLVAQTRFGPRTSGPTKVGPAKGTVIVVGGGSMGPEVYNAFIQAAGGPDALIIDVPTAGGDSVYTQDAPGTRGWKNAGAKNVYVIHTINKKLADSDSFTAIIKKAGGIWFEGGRQFHLVDSYGGTKTEAAFNEVLARGGVIAGSSAGASILGDFMVRGEPSNNNYIMDSPNYEQAFAYLKGVGIDQHVVARERLPDLADSIIPKYPQLLAISEDEGTAWVVKGDTATIIGRHKAFAYNAKDKDPGKPFITLFPGDKFNLATRTVMHRAWDDSPVSAAFVDGLFQKYSSPGAGGATVHIAQNGEVFLDKSYGIPDQARYMPTTTVPQFPLGSMSEIFTSICAQLPPAPAGRGGGRANAAPLTPVQQCVASRVSTPIGMHKTNATADGVVMSDVDELYRLQLGLDAPHTFSRDTTGAGRAFDPAKGWIADNYHGVSRLSAFGVAGGKRTAFVRFPDRHASIIILTNDDNADVKGMADKIADRLLAAKH